MVQLWLLFVHDWVLNKSHFENEAYVERMRTEMKEKNVYRDDDDDWDGGRDDDWDGDKHEPK